MFDLARELEQVALKDDYFIEKNLYPNVDFYSGIIYKALGIPTSMFTVMFAIGRSVGWAAHWREMISDPNRKIARPRQLYTGAGSATTWRSKTVSENAQDVTRISRSSRGRLLPRRHPAHGSFSRFVARFIGLPSIGLIGAWRMPSTGNTVASTDASRE